VRIGRGWIIQCGMHLQGRGRPLVWRRRGHSRTPGRRYTWSCPTCRPCSRSPQGTAFQLDPRCRGGRRCSDRGRIVTVTRPVCHTRERERPSPSRARWRLPPKPAHRSAGTAAGRHSARETLCACASIHHRVRRCDEYSRLLVLLTAAARGLGWAGCGGRRMGRIRTVEWGGLRRTFRRCSSSPGPTHTRPCPWARCPGFPRSSTPLQHRATQKSMCPTGGAVAAIVR
jgi:hypothetical protein